MGLYMDGGHMGWVWRCENITYQLTQGDYGGQMLCRNI